MRQFLREVQADANPSPKHQNAARVATLALRALDRELDLRSEAGDPSPRATPGRKSPPDSGDSLSRPLSVSGAAAEPLAVSTPVIDLACRPAPLSARALFGRQQAQAGGRDETFARYLRAVQTRDSSWLESRVQASGANTGTAADGGFATPVLLNTALWQSVLERSRFLKYCRVVNMRAGTETLPVVNVRDRTVGPAGFSAEKKGEGQTATAQTPVLSEVVLRASKKIVYWDATREWLDDSAPGSSQVLIDSAASEVARELDRDILRGSGTAEPLGVLNAAALIASAKDGGQGANTITYSNLTNMLTRLLPSSFENSVWFCSHTALAQLFSVYLPVGTAGGLPAPLTQNGNEFRLFGRPLIVSDYMPALSSLGDISLFDLSYMIVGLREALRIDTSEHFKFDEDKVSFRVVVRRDVQPILSGTITPAVGASEISPLVALEAR
jgi:HK97 family phage major capsid protein